MLIYLHFGVPPPPSLFQAVSKLEGGHRDGVALWLPVPVAVQLLNEEGGEEVKRRLWDSCRTSPSAAGSFLAHVSPKYYKAWPTLGLQWVEVKNVLPEALGNKALDNEVAGALAEGGRIDEEGLVAKLGELRHHQKSLTRVIRKLPESTDISTLVKVRLWCVPTNRLLPPNSNIFFLPPLRLHSPSKIARLLTHSETDADMLHLESAVHGPRVRLNGVVKSFVASRVVAAFNDPGKRGALEGVWCLDYVLGEGGETGVEEGVARICNDRFPTETMECLAGGLPRTEGIVVEIVRGGGADIEPLKRRCEEDGCGLEGLVESREGREWVDGWVRGVDEPWGVIRKLHERKHQVRTEAKSCRSHKRHSLANNN